MLTQNGRNRVHFGCVVPFAALKRVSNLSMKSASGIEAFSPVKAASSYRDQSLLQVPGIDYISNPLPVM